MLRLHLFSLNRLGIVEHLFWSRMKKPLTQCGVFTPRWVPGVSSPMPQVPPIGLSAWGSSTEEYGMAIPNTYQDQTVILGKQAINLEVL